MSQLTPASIDTLPPCIITKLASALFHGENVAPSADLAKESAVSAQTFEGRTNAAMADAQAGEGKIIAEDREAHAYVSADLGTSNKLKSGATCKKQNDVAHSMSVKEGHDNPVSSRLSSHAGISPHAYACTSVSQRRGEFATTTARANMNPYLTAVPTITPSPTAPYFSPAYLRAMSAAYPAFIAPQQNCFVPSMSNVGGRASVRNSAQGAAFAQLPFDRPIRATYVQNSSVSSTDRTSGDKGLSPRTHLIEPGSKLKAYVRGSSKDKPPPGVGWTNKFVFFRKRKMSAWVSPSRKIELMLLNLRNCEWSSAPTKYKHGLSIRGKGGLVIWIEEFLTKKLTITCTGQAKSSSRS